MLKTAVRTKVSPTMYEYTPEASGRQVFRRAYLVVETVGEMPQIFQNIRSITCVRPLTKETHTIDAATWSNALTVLAVDVHKNNDEGKYYIPLLVPWTETGVIIIDFVSPRPEDTEVFWNVKYNEHVDPNPLYPKQRATCEVAHKASKAFFKLDEGAMTSHVKMLSIGLCTPGTNFGSIASAELVSDDHGRKRLFDNIFEAHTMDKVLHGRPLPSRGTLTYTFDGYSPSGATVELNLVPEKVPDGCMFSLILYLPVNA